MTNERLAELERQGWRLSRDGSTATAWLVWEDPDDPESGWDLLVLHTAGHPAHFTLNVVDSGLTERSAEDIRRLSDAFAEAADLMRNWRGELTGEADIR